MSAPKLDRSAQRDHKNVVEESGLNCLCLIATFHGVKSDAENLRHRFGHGARFDTQAILIAARSLGLTAKNIKQDIQRLHLVPTPVIACDKDGKYFIVAKFDIVGTTERKRCDACVSRQGRVLIQHVGEPPKILSLSTFIDLWDGEFILFTSRSRALERVGDFDFSWFVPSVVKYRLLLSEIFLVSLFIQLIGLVTPLAFQVVMDKVLVNNAITTLNVIAVGLVCAIIFETLLTGVRTYVFSQTSSKIDVELGAKLFSHMLGLPISYFHARRVGDSVARVRELENIRSFLTGNAMTLILDVLFSFIFFAVMFWYSPLLTGVVATSIPLYFCISLIFTPILRKRLNDKFANNSDNQAFLVETVNAIDTVKAMAIEPAWQRKWEAQLAAYVSTSVSATTTAMVATSSVTLVSKLLTAAIMWFGAALVIDHKLSVGELIAFNMLSGQVTSPILRIAQLWSDFQQVGISMRRLGDILNTSVETSRQNAPLPRLRGAITFDDVDFRYRPDSPLVVEGLSLTISPGEVIGIVGRSGSGKSTLTKLVQRLYLPEKGRVLIDGYDTFNVDTVSLRHQLGVVLQENTLFMRSIRDNISLGDTACPLETVVEAAKMAGAHDFICDLPEGYDTPIGEHGTGLSGGQRQRIAIARALITNPRILIFDEATSALDYESEHVIQMNMKEICKNRTVLIIAHRLSAVRNADRIIVMDRGRIAEIGSHSELLRQPSGIYSSLYNLQHMDTVAHHSERHTDGIDLI